jgi:hypothetical protein
MQLLIMSGQRLAGVIYRYPKTRETTPPQRRTCHLRIPSLLMRARGVERHIRAKPLPGLTHSRQRWYVLEALGAGRAEVAVRIDWGANLLAASFRLHPSLGPRALSIIQGILGVNGISADGSNFA